ncbi:peptidase family M50 [Peptococcaceae bacterium CEB3]|nr:peptidase family M50 [Peptococcaceae bacterium CEB3]
MFDFSLSSLIANIPALLIGFAFHEFAHAWVADFLGDPTPRSQGRLTLNPFVHLDIFGSLMALLFRFGWAKPVMTNPSYFKGNPLRGRMLVALAGPVMNLMIAFLAMMLFLVTSIVLPASLWSQYNQVIQDIFMAIILMNLGLGIFNLIPIPPLDGFAVLSGFLPARYARYLWALESYGMLILALVLFTNVLGAVLSPLMSWLFNLYWNIGQLIFAPWLH